MCMWCACVCVCMSVYVCHMYMWCAWEVYVHACICACGVLMVCVCMHVCVHEQMPSLHTNCSLSFETVSVSESGGQWLARLVGRVAEQSPLLSPSAGIPGKHSLGQLLTQCWRFELRSSCMPCRPTEPRSLLLECICIWLHRHVYKHLCCNCTKIALNSGFVIRLGEFVESVSSMWPCLLVRVTTAGTVPLW